MDNNSKNICRLCIGVDDISGEEIEDIHKDLLDVLLIHIDWSLTETPTLCENCCRKLHESFTFKANCIDIEDYSTPIKDNGKFDLRKVCTLLKPSKAVNLICRLCVEWISDLEVTLTEIDKEKFKLYLPEIDLESTTNPVICSECYDSFQSLLSFAESCIQNEQKLVEYCKKLKKRIKSPIALNKFLEYLESPRSSTRVGHLNRKVRSEKSDEYKCDVCFYTTKSVTEIKAHKLSHVNSPDIELLKCPLCPLQTRHKASLRKHINTIHSDKKYFCGSCSFVTKHKVSLARHVANHNASILECNSSTRVGHLNRKVRSEKLDEYKCDVCFYTSKSVTDIEAHKLSHVNSADTELLKCPLCPLQTRNRASLRQHINTVHSDKKYSCGSCSFVTKHMVSLARHVANHNASILECKSCNFKTKFATSLENHTCRVKQVEKSKSVTNSPDFELLKCPMCSLHTRHKSVLRKHINTIHPDKKYSCGSCSFATKYKESLVRHVDNHNAPILECKSCKFKTKFAQSLEIHTCRAKQVEKYSKRSYKTTIKSSLARHSTRHKPLSELKMYKCNFCEYKNVVRRLVAKHMLIHKKSKNTITYKCHHCQFETFRKQCLIKHLQQHDINSDLKIFTEGELANQTEKCSLCDFEASDKWSINRHFTKHLNPSQVEMFKCDECPFESKWGLNGHKKIHRKPSEVNLFKCDKCSFETKWRSSLHSHKKLHRKPSEVNLFKCDECPFESKWACSLEYHKNIHRKLSEVKLNKKK